VTADVGNAAEIAEWTGAGIVVPAQSRPNGLKQADIASAAGAVAELLASPARRETLGRLGRQRWSESFTWEKIATLYEAVYEDAIRRRAA
jgi:glycosyltransferase involved in cell wall biosynthesis